MEERGGEMEEREDREEKWRKGKIGRRRRWEERGRSGSRGGEWVAARVRPSGERGLCRGRVGRPGVGWPTWPAGWLAGSVSPAWGGGSFHFIFI